MSFDLNSIPKQTGRVAIVTGSNVGLGYETALALANKDFEVILACRNLTKAHAARQKIEELHPKSNVICMALDLCSFQSIRAFVKQFMDQYNRLDLLVNNAGLLMPPYVETEDGLESQMASNYFGHFFLTGLLLELLESTEGSRIVTVSSLSHRWNDLDFDNLNAEIKYEPKKGYGRSKLACLMFAYELHRRLSNNTYQVQSIAAHPGVSVTNIAQHLPKFVRRLFDLIGALLFQDAKNGALPILRAALDPDAIGGQYYGPSGFRQYSGKPVLVESNLYAKKVIMAKKLWSESQRLTHAQYLSD